MMTRTTKTKGPAATAIAPDLGSTTPLKGTANMEINTTAPAAPATDDIWGQAVALKHMLSFLTDDLERSLDEKRGKVDGTLVTLMFQSEGIAATMWLASEIWSRVVDLTEAIEAAERAALGGRAAS